ncbi:hypothetical protein ACQP2F_33560 [Actinoplanes sp. CA-030573]|uniref:hypothetical protein n=1 Tax=Actinoplanes sp. CA-030573 TaxID=3239898 RepID=UPI003D914D74
MIERQRRLEAVSCDRSRSEATAGMVSLAVAALPPDARRRVLRRRLVVACRLAEVGRLVGDAC